MSRALETLARLQRAQIDELRIALAGVGAARDTVAAKDGAKVSEMAHEAALVAPADAPAFGAYAGRLNLRDPAFAGLFRLPPTGYLLARRVAAVPFDKMRPDQRSLAS